MSLYVAFFLWTVFSFLLGALIGRALLLAELRSKRERAEQAVYEQRQAALKRIHEGAA